jgi:Tfp pilus assembly protein PilF
MKSLALALVLSAAACAPLGVQSRGDAAFRKAITAQLAGDEERAEVEYRRVIALGINWSPVWNNLAVIAVHRHQYRLARKMLASAVASNSRDVVALTNYGVMSYYLADLREAERTLLGARHLRQENLEQFPTNGRTDWGADHYARATEQLDLVAAKYLDKIARSEVSTSPPPDGEFIAELTGHRL